MYRLIFNGRLSGGARIHDLSNINSCLFTRILIIYNCIIRKAPDVTRVLKELPTRGDAVDKGLLYENCNRPGDMAYLGKLSPGLCHATP